MGDRTEETFSRTRPGVRQPAGGQTPASTAFPRHAPTPLRDDDVRRGSILDRLASSRGDGSVVVISAPPGYGKSTILAQWADADDRPFAWLPLAPADNDPAMLLEGIVHALAGIVPLDPVVTEWAASPRPQFGRTVVPKLAASLAAAPDPFVVAFDDAHYLTAPESVGLVGRMVEHVPVGSTVAISGRAEPALPMGRLRAGGGVLDIGLDDLAFDLEESRSLLGAAGADLDERELEAVVRATEGWAAGLYLAALAHIGGMRSGAPEPFRGNDRLMGDYLRSEVLALHSDDEIAFLTRSSVLDQLSGALCDAVLERSDSAAMLEHLEAGNHLIVPLDRHGEWYRYHHLFADLLQHELDLRSPGERARLLRRASEWCEVNGSIDIAVEYARSSGDVDRVASLFARAGQPLFVAGRSATIEGWARWLDAQGCDDAAFAVNMTWLSMLTGQPADALYWAEIAERRNVTGDLPDGTGSIEPWLHATAAGLCRDGVSRARDDATLSLGALSAGSTWRAPAGVMLGLSLVALGELDAADLAFRETEEVAEARGVMGAVIQSLGTRASLAIERQDWAVASETSRRACDLVEGWRMESFLTSAVAGATMARVAVHEGDPERARRYLERVEPVRPLFSTALPLVAAHGLVEFGKAHLSLGDFDAVESVVEEAEVVIARSADLGRLADGVAELRERLTTARRDTSGVALSPAEFRVLPMLATHLSFREIGEQLFVSQNTVKTQAISIYRKLGVSSRSAAIDRARALGIIPAGTVEAVPRGTR
jgi:LuxR family maltose regulon positive regulatory protein